MNSLDNNRERELKMRELRRQGYTFALILSNGDICPGYHHSMIEMILDLMERQQQRGEPASGHIKWVK